MSVRASQDVTVVAEAPVIETRQSEISTNVTEQQLKTLPQDSRNFLNFAVLAPGVRTSTDENNKEVIARRRPRLQHQRLHRRHELQERRPERRRRRPGFEPRQSVPAERGPGVPGRHAELQGGVREVLERDHLGRHEVGRQRLPRRRLRGLPEQGPRRDGSVRRVHPLHAARRAATTSRSRTTRAGRPESRSAARSSRTGCTSSDPGSTTTSSGTRPSLSEARRAQLPPDVFNELELPDGQLPDAVQGEPRVRQGQLAGGAERHRRLHGLLPARERGQGRRPAARVRGRHGHHQRRLERAGQELLADRQVPERDDRRLPGLQVEPELGRPGHHRAGLPAGAAHRVERQPPELQPEALLRAERLHLARPARLGRPRREGRRDLQLQRVRRPEELQRHSDLPLPIRHPGEPAVRVPVRGRARLRRPGPVAPQQPVRHLRPGRLDDHSAAHRQPRAAVGLREQRAEQRLRDAGARAAGALPVLLARLLHGRQRPPELQERLAAARRLRLRPDGQGPDGPVRRLGTLHRPRRVQRDPRRAVPAPVHDADVPVLRRRPAPRRPADDPLERRVPHPGGPRGRSSRRATARSPRSTSSTTTSSRPGPTSSRRASGSSSATSASPFRTPASGRSTASRGSSAIATRTAAAASSSRPTSATS